MTLPCCTRWLWPRPMILPSSTSTEPMGMPPVARPFLASSIAACRKTSMHGVNHATGRMTSHRRDELYEFLNLGTRGARPSENYLSRKNLADHVFDGHFLNVNVAYRQIIEQRFADGDDAVTFDLKLDGAGVFFNDFTVARQIFRRIIVHFFALNGDEFEISEAIHDFA